MANDLGQMQTEAWAWTDTNLQRLPAAYITRITNGIIADLSRSADLLFNEFTETFPTVVGEGEYALSTTLTNIFSRPFSMWYTDSDGNKIRVTYLRPEVFEKKYQESTDQDAPQNYTIFGGAIIFGPIPDAIYTITFKFYGYPADLSNTADTNAYLTNSWDVIQYGVLGEVCKFLIEDQRVPLFSNEYKERKRRFLIEHARAKTAGARSESREPGWLE